MDDTKLGGTRIESSAVALAGGRWVVLAALLTLVLAGPSPAQDAPHWASVSIDIDCTNQCHLPHQSAGGALTSAAGNVNLCQSCHNAAGLASDLPISSAAKAVRGVSGTSHAFDVPATQDFDGDAVDDVVPPTDTEMSLRVVSGNIVCSTCHNQHRSESAFGGTPRVGNARQITALGSTGAMASGGVYSGAEGTWYLVEIVQAGNENTARFCYSKDNGISWFPSGCDPPGTTTPNLTADGANPVTLDSGVAVTFGTGNYVAQERWELSAAWPFLRANLGAGGSGMCLECHGAWNVADAGTFTGSPLSHPVGVPIPAGDFHSPPLDGNGAVQGGGGADANASNDLQLFSSNVQCLTCHGVHFVDSNTQTEDQP